MHNIMETENLSIVFGGLKAVSNVNIHIKDKELLGLIGPNGAGKTTIFNLLTGVYKPTEGDILLDGKSIIRKNTSSIVEMGVSRTFQNIRLFKNLTVLENVKIAFDNKLTYNNFDALFRTKKYRKQEKESTDKALALLDIFDMSNMAYLEAGNLSYGQQRKLEIIRALATEPKILLLDEPAAGMNPQETKELMNIIKMIRDKFQISILIIEHDMDLVMGICERLYVLNFGNIIAEGNTEEIQNNTEVIKAYLGE